MVDVMTVFGVDEQEAKKQMAQVYLFEEKIAEVRIKSHLIRKKMFFMGHNHAIDSNLCQVFYKIRV